MAARTIEQLRLDRGRCVARSAGVTDEQVDLAEQRAAALGTPAGAALAVAPLGSAVGVFQVRGAITRVLVFPGPLYRAIGDPFHIDRTLPFDGTTDSDPPTLVWETGPSPVRKLKDVQAILQTDESAMLLGATQALVEGGRVAFARPGPDPGVIERIWTLLPDADRGERTLATWLPGDPAGFDIVIAPQVEGRTYSSYLTEDRAGDYPEGRYELALQAAAETDDADGLDQLFARRSMSQSVRLALTLLILGILGGLAVRFIPWHKLR
jgi:hypothetical protein